MKYHEKRLKKSVFINFTFFKLCYNKGVEHSLSYFYLNKKKLYYADK